MHIKPDRTNQQIHTLYLPSYSHCRYSFSKQQENFQMKTAVTPVHGHNEANKAKRIKSYRTPRVTTSNKPETTYQTTTYLKL